MDGRTTGRGTLSPSMGMALLTWACLLASGNAMVYTSAGAGLAKSASPVAHNHLKMAMPSRREAVGSLLAVLAFPAAASAGDSKLWLSGKPDPIRPTSKDKPDGTKKDGKYLSCLNDCVPRKQGPPGPAQLERVDCLDDCQQECCTTYEQCTYTIRK